MSYSHTLTCIVPLGLMDIAGKVGRALDPDVGGGDSFNIKSSSSVDGVVTHLIMHTRCTSGFASLSQNLIASPPALLAYIEKDYVARWPDVALPSSDDIAAFCAGSTLAVNVDLQAYMSSAGLKRIEVGHE